MPLSKRWKLALMLALVAASLGLSGYAFYRALRPKIVERVVEKPVERPVPQECPKIDFSKQQATPHTKKDKSASPTTTAPSQTATGNNNSQVGGGITTGDCSPVQVGGSNNQASVNCVPPERTLNQAQLAAVRRVFDSLPDSVRVFVQTIGNNGEALRYAQQFQDVAVERGKSGNPKAVILGLFWRPVPLGLIIASHSDSDVAAKYRDDLVKNLGAENISAVAKVGEWITANQLYIVVGENRSH